MASPFARMRAAIERLVFAGLKPDAPIGTKKSKIGALIDSAEDLAGRGLKPDDAPLPGPMSWTKKLGIVLGILMIPAFIYMLVQVLLHSAEQSETEGPAHVTVQILPKDFKVDKNKDVEVVEIEFNKNKEPKESTGTLRNLTDRSFSKCE